MFKSMDTGTVMISAVPARKAEEAVATVACSTKATSCSVFLKQSGRAPKLVVILSSVDMPASVSSLATSADVVFSSIFSAELAGLADPASAPPSNPSACFPGDISVMLRVYSAIIRRVGSLWHSIPINGWPGTVYDIPGNRRLVPIRPFPCRVRTPWTRRKTYKEY